MGYKYGEARAIGQMNDSWRRNRINYFMVEYSAGLVKQTLCTHVIVYTDETYVNLNHSRVETWYKPGDPELGHVVKPSGRGARVVILHAFSKDGWLMKDPKIFMNRADQYLPSAELVYEAANSDGDYHKNMNGEIFLNWENHRLIPAFEAKYGRKKKMILVLDNAAYHHWMGPNGWTPSKLNKKQLLTNWRIFAS